MAPIMLQPPASSCSCSCSCPWLKILMPSSPLSCRRLEFTRQDLAGRTFSEFELRISFACIFCLCAAPNQHHVLHVAAYPVARTGPVLQRNRLLRVVGVGTARFLTPGLPRIWSQPSAIMSSYTLDARAASYGLIMTVTSLDLLPACCDLLLMLQPGMSRPTAAKKGIVGNAVSYILAQA